MHTLYYSSVYKYSPVSTNATVFRKSICKFIHIAYRVWKAVPRQGKTVQLCQAYAVCTTLTTDRWPGVPDHTRGTACTWSVRDARTAQHRHLDAPLRNKIIGVHCKEIFMYDRGGYYTVLIYRWWYGCVKYIHLQNTRTDQLIHFHNLGFRHEQDGINVVFY